MVSQKTYSYEVD